MVALVYCLNRGDILEKIAVIDLGSSKIELTLAKYTESGNYVIYRQMSETIKIVDSYDDDDGLLTVGKTKEPIEILKMYKMICEVNQISNIIAVASSSLRTLKNYRSFMDEIYNVCGLKMRVMTEEDELSTLYSGIVNSLDAPKGVVAYISGGSVRIIQYNRRNIINAAIVRFGTYSLAKVFDEEANTALACQKMVQKFKEELDKIEWLDYMEGEFSLIGYGSVCNNCAILSRKLRKYPMDMTHNYVMSSEQLNDVYNLISSLEINKNKKIKGTQMDRSDVLASGICMLKALFQRLPFQNITMSTKGITEGLLNGAVVPVNVERPADMLGVCLENSHIFYDDENNNSRQVSNLAIILFRQLKVLHKLPRGYTKVVRIAANMHDCGQRIKFFDHEKNSFHIILNTEFIGASHRETALAAFISANQATTDFNLAEWIKYKDIMQEEDLEAVKKLALIIRLAEALDKTHRGVVQDISCDILGDSVIMKTIVTMPAAIEIREAQKVASDFKKIFGKTLEIL